MSDYEDKELDHLLARGRLSGRAREQILRDALPRATHRRRWAWLAATAGTCAAAATVLLLARPSGFRARGGGGGALLEVHCRSGARDRCAKGELLVFQVDGAASGGALAAWAEPAGGGERVWYFPSASGAMPALAPQPGPQVLAEAVRLGPEQPPGIYEIHLALYAGPLGRDAIAATRPLVAQTRRLEVVP